MLLRNDPTSEVRKNVLANIEMNDYTIAGILERARDLDVNVRKMLYKKLLIDFEVDAASPQQLLELIETGLNDR
jgi:uncharacterized membrane protein